MCFIIKKNNKLLNIVSKIDKYWYVGKDEKAKKLVKSTLKKSKKILNFRVQDKMFNYLNTGKILKAQEYANKKFDSLIFPDTLEVAFRAYFDAEVSFAKGLYEEAVKNYDIAIMHKGYFSHFYFMKAKCFFELKRPNDAMATLNRGLFQVTSSNGKIDLLFEKVNYLISIEEFNTALLLLDEMLGLGKNKNWTSKNHIKKCTTTNNIEFSPMIDEGTDKDAYKDAEIFIAKGFIYSYLEDYKNELKCYEKALLINPKEKVVHYNMAWYFRMQGNYKKALKSINFAIKINKNDEDLYWLKASMLRKLNRFTESIKCYKKYLKIMKRKSVLDTNRFNAEYKIAKCYVSLEKYIKAHKFCEKSIINEPLFLDAYLLNIEILTKLNKYAEASVCKTEYDFVADTIFEEED